MRSGSRRNRSLGRYRIAERQIFEKIPSPGKKFKVKISKKFYFCANNRSSMPEFRCGQIFSG